MPFIHLTTFISAPQERIFDLARSVDVHKNSMSKYQEKIINGTVSGLMNVGDTVTWSAKHLFKQRILKVELTKMQRPDYFIDEQVKGEFAMMKHEHYFKPIENGTLMIDQFHFETSGVLGKLLNRIYLEKYMTELLTTRNEMIRNLAEGNQWKQFINQ
ncbi:MAG: SRPBCC family protein [Flavisolibacter sp.]